MRARLNLVKNFAANVTLGLTSVALMFALLEIVLRFLPVRDDFLFQPVNEENPVFRARGSRIVTSSAGWDFYNARDIKFNNAGYRNDLNRPGFSGGSIS